jgi:biotin carboxyl carrier protein
MILDATIDGRTLRVDVREEHDGSYIVKLDEQALRVDARDAGRGLLSLIIEGQSHAAAVERHAEGYTVVLGHQSFEVGFQEAAHGLPSATKTATGPAKLKAPMPGKIVRLLASVGADVTAGQGLVVMEAMKMENELKAPRAGRVKELPVQEGQTVDAGTLLAVVE